MSTERWLCAFAARTGRISAPTFHPAVCNNVDRARPRLGSAEESARASGMSHSPTKRREMDVMKLCAALPHRSPAKMC